jgi:hypothetical protein
MKYDYAYAVGQLKPDAILQFWSLDPYTPPEGDPDGPPDPVPGTARPYVKDDYERVDFGPLYVYFQKDSGDVLWDVVEQMGTTSAASP